MNPVIIAVGFIAFVFIIAWLFARWAMPPEYRHYGKGKRRE